MYEPRVSTPEERRAIMQNETQAFSIALRDGWVPEEEIPVVKCEACGGDGDVECGKCDGDGQIDCHACRNLDAQLDLFARSPKVQECVDHVITSEYATIDCEACGGDGKVACVSCAGAGSRPERPMNHPADEWTIAALNKIPVGAPAKLGPTPDWLKKERAKQKAKDTRIRSATRAIAR